MEPVVRVFRSGDSAEARERLAFLGAAGEDLDGFLRDLRALIVAAPAGLSGATDPQTDRFLASRGVPVLRTASHLLFSVSSPDQAAEWRDKGPRDGILHRVAAAVQSYFTRDFQVPLPGGILDLAGPPLVMGIVNVTPDSFSDGGVHRTSEEAVTRGLEMEEQGAAILDVGGESTRPGSDPVPADEELRRVLPVIRGLAARTSAVISVDTTKAAVAKAAIAAGARIVNDTSALADDPGMAAVIRESGAAVVLMHRRGTPSTMQAAPRYDFLFDELLGELSERIDAATAAWIGRERILVDPGVGFGKRPCDNLALHRHLDELRVLGRPIVFGPSRKSFIGALTGAPPAKRVFGTAASVTAAVMSGAHVVRVHDVKEMREVVQVADAIRRAGPC
jgi:dihydropteroate synthase